MVDWVLTIPKSIPWDEYQKELDACANDSDIEISYRLPYKPKAMPKERCYVVHDGFIRGYQEIIGVDYLEGFDCITTGQHWRSGWYIVRGGMFHKTEPVPMKGFRGIRRLDAEACEQESEK